MPTALRWTATVILGLSSGLVGGWAAAQADPAAPAPSAPVTAAPVTAAPVTAAPAPATPVPVEADWPARAMAWFSTNDEQGRRKEMRTITRALRQPCRYCHTPDFTGYTDKRLISQQMMAASAEHGVGCDACHAGRDAFTELGTTSASMWALARARGQFCEACHTPGERFEALTDEGRRFKANGWPAWKAKWAARAKPTRPTGAAATDTAPAQPDADRSAPDQPARRPEPTGARARPR